MCEPTQPRVFVKIWENRRLKFGSKRAIFGMVWGVLRSLDLVWELATPPNHIWEKFPKLNQFFYTFPKGGHAGPKAPKIQALPKLG